MTLLSTAMLATPLISAVQAKRVTETDMGFYTEYVGTLGGANFVVRIPNEGWNGMLVVGCHGYMALAWTPDAQFAMDELPTGAGIGLPFALVEQGFAYAASSYGEGGFSVKMGMIRTHQLTQYVIGKFGVTGKVFIVGHSNEIARGALLLVSDMPLVPEGVKTESSDKMVTEKYSNLHLQIGIEAMTEIGEKGEEIKHFRY